MAEFGSVDSSQDAIRGRVREGEDFPIGVTPKRSLYLFFFYGGTLSIWQLSTLFFRPPGSLYDFTVNFTHFSFRLASRTTSRKVALDHVAWVGIVFQLVW